MEETNAAEENKKALEILDWSLVFLLVLIAGILLSFSAATAQRDGIARILLCGPSETVPDVYPLRWKTGVLTAGASGFFAFLACRTLKEAERQGDCAAKRSARSNALAAALAFAATLIRLDDLEFIGASRQSAALEETLTPE